jgi:2-oxoglutarate ferredoxin oxidoreductase subunit beta
LFAIADAGSDSKHGVSSADALIDTISLASIMGVSVVARSFSCDRKQLVPLVNAAIPIRAPPLSTFPDAASLSQQSR